MKVWNELREPGPKLIRQLPDARRRQYARALKTLPNLDDWRIVIRYMNSQPWANAKGSGDHPNWRASLDWLTKPGKAAEYLEKARLDAADTSAGGIVGRDPSRGRTGIERGKYAHLKGSA